MKALITTVLLYMLCTATFAALSCPQATSTDNPGFCPSFKSVAQCHCTATGLPSQLCQDMNSIYKRMIAMFGSVQRACEYQKDTTTQICIDDWSCYKNGGTDSQGRACSGTGLSCQ